MRKFAALVVLLAAAPPRADEVEHGYADVGGGVKLYYEARGSGSPLVLLHGGLNTIETSFAKVLPDLARRYRVIGLEQVGHGHTADTDQPLSYAKMAEHTAAALRKLGVARADLVGWSDGGIVAILVAASHPDLVRKVVVAGVNTRLDGLPPKSVQWLRDSTPESLAKGLRPELRAAYERSAPDPARWPVLAKKTLDLWLTPVYIEKAQLAAVKAPTLIVAGDQDKFATAEHSVEIFRSIPRSQLWIVPGTGHDTFGARPASMVQVISEFLDAPITPARSAADVVQTQLDAFNAQDLEAFLATYADDAAITTASTGNVVMQGKAVMRERYGSMFRKYPNNRCRIAERRVEGDRVVLDHEIITGRAPDKPDPWDLGWVRYEVEGGLIRRVQLP